MEPEAPVTGILSLPAFQHPAHLTFAPQDAVFQVERSAAVDRLRDRSFDVVAIVGMDDAGKRPHRVADEVAGGIAGDRLDLVAQPVHRPIAVARAPIQGTRDVVHHRAQQRLVGA